MTDVLDDVLGDKGEAKAAEAPKASPEGEGPAPQPQTPPAGTPTTPGTDAAPGTDTATPTGATTPPPGYVPLSALLDDREKRQKAQAEADRLKAELAKLQQQQPSPPSYQDDPEGWARTLEQRTAEIRRDTKFEQSEMFAVMAHGADLVEKAKAWSEDKARSEASAYGYSPFVTMLHHQRHPLDWVVNEYKQAQRLAEIGTDWDAWARKRAAELAAQTEPSAPLNGGAHPQPANTAPKPSFSPPKSLVDAPSAGGIRKGAPVGPMEAFETVVFPK